MRKTLKTVLKVLKEAIQWVAFLFLCFVIINGSEASVKKQAKITFAGDSLAVGYGMYYNGPEAIENIAKNSSGLINKRFYNWPSKMSAYCSTKKTDYIVFSIGANDIQPINGHKVGSMEWKTAYQKLLDELILSTKNCNAQIIFIEPPPFNDKREANLDFIRDTIKEHVKPAIYIETKGILTDENGVYLPGKTINGKYTTLRAKDGVHMTIKGYSYISNLIAQRIEEMR